MAIGRGLNPNQAGISDPAHRFVELDDLDQQTALSSPLPPPLSVFHLFGIPTTGSSH